MPRSAAPRRKLNALPMIAPAAPEAEHFLTCKACGQPMDLRNLGDVLHHEEPGHAPLAASEPIALKFIPPQLPTLADEPPRATSGSTRSSRTGIAPGSTSA